MDYEVPIYTTAILNLDTLPLDVRIEILIKATSTILTINCSSNGLLNAVASQQVRQELVNTLENRIVEIIHNAFETNVYQQEILSLVNAYGSVSLQEKVMKDCYACHMDSCLYELDSEMVETYLQQSSYLRLHEFYWSKQRYLDAIVYFYKLSFAKDFTLRERKEFLDLCIEDIVSLEQSGHLIQLPEYLNLMRLTMIERVLRYQLMIVDNSAMMKIYSRDELISYLVCAHRYDLYLQFVKEEGNEDLAFIKSIWYDYLTYLKGVNTLDSLISSLYSILLQLKGKAIIPLSYIILFLHEMTSLEKYQSIIVECHVNRIGSDGEIRSILYNIYELDRSEKHKIRAVKLILEYVKCDFVIT